MKISITHCGNTTSFETERDEQDLAEMVSIIKGMMVSVGFHPNSVDDYFVGAEGEWFPDLEEKTKKALSFPELDELSMTKEPKLSHTKMDALIDGVKEAF